MNLSKNAGTLLKAIGVLAVLALILVIAVVIYVAIAKPFGIKVQNIPGAIMKSQSSETKTASDNPLLTAEQETALESLGVDTSALPTSITPEMSSCFSAKLGDDRVQEIKAGSSLTVTDFFKAQSCIE